MTGKVLWDTFYVALVLWRVELVMVVIWLMLIRGSLKNPTTPGVSTPARFPQRGPPGGALRGCPLPSPSPFSTAMAR
jgi:hypothetical protein